MMNQAIKVVLSEEATKQYEELNRIVGEELRKGITNSIHQQLLKSIKQKSELLKINPQAGMHIPKKLIPKGRANDVFLDLIQEGNLGLMKAVERYDVSFNTRFSTYASFWINQSLYRYVHHNKLMRAPDDVSQKM